MTLYDQVLQFVISGISTGSIYAIVGLGFMVIYSVTRVVNFAQGELMMIGAFVVLTLINTFSLPYWLAFPMAVLLMGIFGMALDRIVIRPLVGEPVLSIVMVTIGFGILSRSVVSCIPAWGTETLGLETPFADQNIRFAGSIISMEHLAVIGFTVVLIVIMYCFFKYTRVGVGMQAVSENQLAAAYMGISVKKYFSLIWATSAAVAGVAGVLLAPITFVHVNMGYIGLRAFPAAVLGGFGSIPGAIVGGLIIGITESLAGLYLPMGWKDIAAYIILIVVLMVKPEGIFGTQQHKKV